MHVRVNTITGATDIDRGIAVLRDRIVPELVGAKGFRGLTCSGDRATGDVGILTLWETREDLEASDSAAAKLRAEAMAIIGGSVTLRIMEEVVGETAAPPSPGSRLRLVNIKMDPARVDEHVAFFKSDVLPEIRASAGFVSVRNLIDRATGEGVVGTIWADEASMRAAEPAAAERQARARSRGIEIGDPSYREVLFAHLV
jgi:heme-degrading monooxygenase HmoA